jgi:hypothetical protein
MNNFQSSYLHGMTQRHRHSIFLPEDKWLWVTKHWAWQHHWLTSPYLELNWCSWREAWWFYNRDRELHLYREVGTERTEVLTALLLRIEVSCCLGCDAVSLGVHFLTFSSIMVPSSLSIIT